MKKDKIEKTIEAFEQIAPQTIGHHMDCINKRTDVEYDCLECETETAKNFLRQALQDLRQETIAECLEALEEFECPDVFDKKCCRCVVVQEVRNAIEELKG